MRVPADWTEAHHLGHVGIERLTKQLVDTGDTSGLGSLSAWLAASDSSSDLKSPWLAWIAARLGRVDEAIERYRTWLQDAEAPAALHLALLCRLCQKQDDVEGVFEAAARFHPFDLGSAPRRAAAASLSKALAARTPQSVRAYRIALVGTFTTTAIGECLRVGAARLGLAVDLYEADFDMLRAEVADLDSRLYAHQPEVVILATSWRDIDPGRTAAEQAAEWAAVWDTVLARTKAHVLQHTFDRPVESPNGHLDTRHASSIRRIAADLNARLAELAPDRVTLVDYDQAIYRFGATRWCDPRQWYWAKEAVSDEAAPHLVEEYLAVLRALIGKTSKVLVLDLDNTMWGGIVGEDGVYGLKIGPPSLEGEAHLALQRYARALSERGVLLAVASKNNPDDAKEPFQKLRDMVLGLDDFVAFEATWNDKPTSVRKIAKALNLGLDSFVFVDDNPAERALMRRTLPEVLTVPVHDPPNDFVMALDRTRAFEVLAVSAEDRARTSQYRTELDRADLEASSGSLEDYYRALEMRAEINPFDAADLTRIVQLAARSNQFNLTTWRMSSGEVRELIASSNHETFTVRLQDRFGDHGLVVQVVGEVRETPEGRVLDIVQWCMSCRVLKRTVEDLVRAELDQRAGRRGCRWLAGTYRPTKKNGMVKEFYAELGFEKTCEAEDGSTTWRLAVDAGNPRTNPYIRIRRSS